MDNKRFFAKYVTLLLIYIVIVRFVEPYGLKLYYTLADNPISDAQSVQVIQSIMTLIGFVINLIISIIMIVDSKSKKLLDWLIIIVTFFSPECGIVVFILWQTNKNAIKQLVSMPQTS